MSEDCTHRANDSFQPWADIGRSARLQWVLNLDDPHSRGTPRGERSPDPTAEVESQIWDNFAAAQVTLWCFSTWTGS